MTKRKVVFSEMTEDFELLALVTSVKKQKKSEKFIDFSSIKQTTMKVSLLIKLRDLTIEDQQYILKEIKKQLLTKAQPCDYKLLNIKYKNEMYEIEYTVRYLHPAARVAIKNFSSIEGYIITDSLTLPTKPSTNINLMKYMIEIVTDSSQTKE